MVETLLRLFRYDEWANDRAMASVRAVPAPPPRAVQLLAHIVAAQSLWLERIRAVPQSLPVWPDWPLDEVESQLPRVTEAWRTFLGQCDESALQREFDYTNTKGNRFRNNVADTALHVAMHGTYHRGQIATLLRQNGGQPAYTDFIEAVRTGNL